MDDTVNENQPIIGMGIEQSIVSTTTTTNSSSSSSSSSIDIIKLAEKVIESTQKIDDKSLIPDNLTVTYTFHFCSLVFLSNISYIYINLKSSTDSSLLQSTKYFSCINQYAHSIMALFSTFLFLGCVYPFFSLFLFLSFFHSLSVID